MLRTVIAGYNVVAAGARSNAAIRVGVPSASAASDATVALGVDAARLGGSGGNEARKHDEQRGG